MAKSLDKINQNQTQKKMEAREGMTKIKEYETEQNVIHQKIKENRDKKISDILNYNGMLNQKRKDNF